MLWKAKFFTHTHPNQYQRKEFKLQSFAAAYPIYDKAVDQKNEESFT